MNNGHARQSGRRPPNILLIFIDSLRADRVGCYGYDRPTTPTLDRLAEESCLFRHAVTAAPFSPASYASIISGLYPHQHGVDGDAVRVWPAAMPRLPANLRESGYTTFCFSNNSFVSRTTGAADGFDIFVDRDDSVMARPRDRLYRWVRRRLGDRRAKRLSNTMHCAAKGDSAATLRQAASLIRGLREPWFGFIILMDPHTPYNRRRARHCGDASTARQFFIERNDRAMWTELMAEHGRLSAAELSIVSDLYDAEVRHADACLGDFLATMSSGEQLDRTVLAVAADHGEAFGEHGVWGHGFCLTDCLTRVPLILRHPEFFPRGSSCDALVQLHDLHDTCLAVAQSRPVADNDGCDLRHGADDLWTGREAVFSEFPRQARTLEFMRRHKPLFVPGRWGHDMWSVRTMQWRYIEYGDGTCDLYDLEADPDQTRSVHRQHPEVCDHLAARLVAHREDRPFDSQQDNTPQEVDELVLERLRSLGYIE